MLRSASGKIQDRSGFRVFILNHRDDHAGFLSVILEAVQRAIQFGNFHVHTYSLFDIINISFDINQAKYAKPALRHPFTKQK